ncbi:MAG TPA: metal ABC transporter ATP-binding protein [Candidatus Saccharimonadales bacterium]|nr:metal ABC transporter ATP-binding protein [Candidatus Saccharimonadales bacterium]
MQPVKLIFKLENVCFAYGKEEVLHHISLEIQAGSYVGIVGPNGGGKTTILKIMLGLLKPKKGTVELFGMEARKFKERERIGYVPQKVTNFDISFPATVEEVVSMGLFAKRGLFHSLTPADHREAHQALEKVDMLQYATRLIGDLSGGQQQRVFIARALASNPEVIILDEPTAGVDEAAQGEFYRLLKRLNRDHGLTLILVSHDGEIIEREASELFRINKVITEVRKINA